MHSEAGLAENAGQRYVLQYFCGDCGVAARGFVGSAPDENILTVRSDDSRVWIAYPFRRILRRELGENYRHDRALGERDDHLLGRVGQEISPLSLRFVEGPRQRT